MVDTRTREQIINDNRHKIFSFNEAIEFMKYIDKQPTGHTINWVNAKTGKPVAIGYTT